MLLRILMFIEKIMSMKKIEITDAEALKVASMPLRLRGLGLRGK